MTPNKNACKADRYMYGVWISILVGLIFVWIDILYDFMETSKALHYSFMAALVISLLTSVICLYVSGKYAMRAIKER